MTTFAIIGAGPGLGMASAKKFGHEGFSVALITRNEEKLQRLVSQLREEGITADAFTADIRDRDSLKSALDTAAAQLGTIEVVQYSPVPAREFMKSVLEAQPEDLNGPLELSVLGPVTVVQQVLGGMRELGRGTFLFPNGGSAVKPRNEVTGTSVAFAGESAYAQLLHEQLKVEGIHVAQLIIPLGIDGGEPDHASAVLAEKLWGLHTERGEFRTYVRPVE